jgi:two-component system, NtrC family, sensor kinase
MDTAIGCALISYVLSTFTIKYLNIPTNHGEKYDILKILWLPTAIIGFIIKLIGLNLLSEYAGIISFLPILAIFYAYREDKYVRNILLIILPYLFFATLDIIYFYYTHFVSGKGIDLSSAGFGIAWAVGFGIYLHRQGKKQREEEEKLLKENQVLELKNVNLESLVDSRTKEISSKNEELERKIEELNATQEQLIHSEKMASLGELTAGIAHEIQNPLNFVNNFADVSTELVDEIRQELDRDSLDKDALLEILADMKSNLEKIVHHGKRADNIVKGMLQHSRKGSGEKELTDINALSDEYLRLSYHGLRAKNKSFNAIMETDFSVDDIKILAYPQEIGRVLLNIITNAFHATQEKKIQALENNQPYSPLVRVETKKLESTIIISIIDNGAGIPDEKLDKIFQPFYTTKPTGQGTGLGLSIAYDIITKLHGGKINVESKVGEGTKFIITLPYLTQK